MFEIEQMQMNKQDIKPSKNRLLILNFLNTSSMTHLTADDIFEHFRNSQYNISLATIYNTLNLFKEKKIVSFVRMQNGEYKYETTLDEHVHFECTKCKKIYNMPSLNDYFEEINKGFSIQETEVLFRGICSDCNK
jgi:possible ferric uptake regulator protein